MAEGTGSSSGPDSSGGGPTGGGSSGPDPSGGGPSKPDPSKLGPSGMTQSTSMNSMNSISSECSYTENDLKVAKKTNLENYKFASDVEKAKLYKEAQDELEATKLAFKRYKASGIMPTAIDLGDDRF